MDTNKEKKYLQDNLNIPINKFEYENDKCIVFSANDSIIIEIPYTVSDDKITYNIGENLLMEMNWEIVVQENYDDIYKALNSINGLTEFNIVADEVHFLRVENNNGENLHSAICEYFDGKWNVDYDINSKIKILSQQFNELKNVLTQPSIAVDPVTHLMEQVVKHGGPLYKEWLNAKASSNVVQIEKGVEFEKLELASVERLDRRDKIFKFLVILVCILSLSILAWKEKSSSVAPVIGVVIGLVLQGNVITEYFSGALKKRKVENGYEE